MHSPVKNKENQNFKIVASGGVKCMFKPHFLVNQSRYKNLFKQLFVDNLILGTICFISRKVAKPRVCELKANNNQNISSQNHFYKCFL